MLNVSSVNKSIIITPLPIGMCILLNLPPPNGLECAERAGDDPNCIFCYLPGRFLSGEGMDEYWGSGHVVTMVMGILTVIIGSWASLSSCLIITVLRRQNSGRSFDILLTSLACFDLLASMSAVCGAASLILWFQNYSRNLVTMVTFLAGLLTVLFAKSGSSFITVTITVERYVAIAHPFSTRAWLTPFKTKLIAWLVSIFALCMAIPRYTSTTIGKNRIGRGIPSTSKLNYLFYQSKFEAFWHVDLHGIFNLIDYYLPLPLLLFFNGMLFYYVRKLSANRKNLNTNQTTDLNAGRMFIPVVLVLLVCNVVPMAHHYSFRAGTIYREGIVGVLLSVALNSAANLPIYYWKSEGFRKEAKKVVLKLWFPCRNGKESERCPE